MQLNSHNSGAFAPGSRDTRFGWRSTPAIRGASPASPAECSFSMHRVRLSFLTSLACDSHSSARSRLWRYPFSFSDLPNRGPFAPHRACTGALQSRKGIRSIPARRVICRRSSLSEDESSPGLSRCRSFPDVTAARCRLFNKILSACASRPRSSQDYRAKTASGAVVSLELRTQSAKNCALHELFSGPAHAAALAPAGFGVFSKDSITPHPPIP